MIIPYLTDIMNDHKAKGEWNVHSGNEIINCKTQGAWKIQLIMIVNFISSKDSDEIRTMHTKSNNVEIMIANEQNFLNLFSKIIRKY